MFTKPLRNRLRTLPSFPAWTVPNPERLPAVLDATDLPREARRLIVYIVMNPVTLWVLRDTTGTAIMPAVVFLEQGNQTELVLLQVSLESLAPQGNEPNLLCSLTQGHYPEVKQNRTVTELDTPNSFFFALRTITLSAHINVR